MYSYVKVIKTAWHKDKHKDKQSKVKQTQSYNVRFYLRSRNRKYEPIILPTTYNVKQYEGPNFQHISHISNNLVVKEKLYSILWSEKNCGEGWWWWLHTPPSSPKHFPKARLQYHNRILSYELQGNTNIQTMVPFKSTLWYLCRVPRDTIEF